MDWQKIYKWLKFEKAEIVQIFLVAFTYPTLFIECLPILGTVNSAVIKVLALVELKEGEDK